MHLVQYPIPSTHQEYDCLVHQMYQPLLQTYLQLLNQEEDEYKLPYHLLFS